MIYDQRELDKMARLGQVIQTLYKGNPFLLEAGGIIGKNGHRVEMHTKNVVLISSHGPYKAVWLKEAVYHPKWKRRLNMFYQRLSWDELKEKIERSGLPQFIQLTKEHATTIPSMRYLERNKFGNYSFCLHQKVLDAFKESLKYYHGNGQANKIDGYPPRGIVVDGKYQQSGKFRRMADFHRLMRPEDPKPENGNDEDKTLPA